MTDAAMQKDEVVLNRFAMLIAKQRLAHAYLFIGPEGIGKHENAKSLAKLVICENREKNGLFCSCCPACIKVESGNHPDVIVVESEEGQTIKIARIRALLAQTQLRPFETEKKIFILKNADKITTEGSNALLKTLEEPTQSNLFILTTSMPERILGTIRSRCHGVHFFSSSNEKLVGQLKSDYTMGDTQAQFFAYYSEGCLAKARHLSEEKFFDKKNEVIDNIVFHENNEAYIKSVLSDKELTKEALNVLLFWFRDLLLLKASVTDDRLVNQDRKKELMALSSRYTYKQLNSIIKEVVNTMKLLNENLNVKIPMTILKEKIWVR